MTNQVSEIAIEQLSVSERLELIDRLWESLPETVVPHEIPDWHLAELAKRRVESAARHEQGRPWRDVLAALESKS